MIYEQLLISPNPVLLRMQPARCNLSDCFLCAHCLPEWREVIGLHKKTWKLKKGDFVIREGDPVRGIYFLYAGAVKVFTAWTGQKELILRFAKQGDIVGHRGLGGVDTYPVSARALEDSVVCFISSEFLESTLITNPSLTYRLMHFYATELLKAERRMRALAHQDVRGRIAQALLELAGQFGTDKSQYINLSIKRQDIASYAGTTYETVFKFFTWLIREKIITTSGKKIRINQPDRLAGLVDGSAPANPGAATA
ncbi:MAG TPA: Crp/Fnr family transcriptional regulator [Chitinophagaceae bacterium]|nr:Crp/Fnr family transcriptional regulator [Chitinophagaceae bacterium]